MYGTLRGALAGRKIAFDRESYIATVEGRREGCPAHQSVQGAIEVTWEARVRFGAEVVTLRSA